MQTNVFKIHYFTILSIIIIINLFIVTSESIRHRGKNIHQVKNRNKTTAPLHHKINTTTTTTTTTTAAPKIDAVTPEVFLTGNSSERVQQGSTAILECKIEDIINITVRWYKVGVAKPLTENKTTLSDDKRYLVENSTDATDWSLKIRLTKESDGGSYECWASKRTSASIFVNLTLVEARAKIIGADYKTVKPGSPLRLSCVLKHSIEAPAYIFWYKKDRVINYDLQDGTVREGRQGSELIFPRADSSHSGNYSCVPSNAAQASVEVKVV